MNFNKLNLKAFLFKAILPCAILLIILFAYSDVWHHQFLVLDDTNYVFENGHVQEGLNLRAIRWAFGFTGISYWHPLTWISHMLDIQLFGPAPGAHHMVNLAMHILSAIFLFLILFRMTGARYKSALVALLFAIHPVNVESVAWIAERKTVLSMFFLMTAIYSYVCYAEKKELRFYMFSLLLYCLGLMSKPSILTLPFLLLVLDYWPIGRFGRGNDNKLVNAVETTSSMHSYARFITLLKADVVFLILEKVPFVILSLISTYMSMISMSKHDMVINVSLIPIDLRIYNYFVSIVKYLVNIAWPISLSIFYPFPKSIPTAHFLLALTFVILITIVTFLWRKNRPWFLVGWLWFLIALMPAGGLIQAGLWPEMANRFMYIPMIGLFLMLVWECDVRIRGHYSNIVKVVLCCAVLVYFVSLTRIQNIYFSNSYALFARAAAVTEDNYFAYTCIGDALLSLNRVEEAMKYYLKAVTISPRYDRAINNYGACLSRTGDYTSADLYFTSAIAINPKYAAAYVNLALNQYHRGYSDEGKKLLAKAMELDPNDGNINNYFGEILAAQGKTEEAIHHFQIAAEKKSNLILVRTNLSLAYEKAGLFDRAIEEFGILNNLAPANKGVNYYRMAGIYAKQKKYQECKNYLNMSLKHGFDVLEHLKSDERFTEFRETELYTQLMENQTHKGK